MEFKSEVESNSQNDSVSSSASNARYREETVSPEEQALLQLLRRGVLETAEENVTLGKEISTLLCKLNLESQMLPNDIKDGLQKVALVLRSEKLSDLDETATSIVRERKKIEEKRAQREEKKLALMHDDVFRRSTSLSKKLDYIQEAVNSIEVCIENEREERKELSCKQILFLKKLVEYQQTVEKLESILTNMEVEELYPKKVLAKYQRYLEMSGELVELNRTLSQYSDLPPNLLQAKSLLEAKQKEYEILEQEFLEKTSCS